jgi:hypothetical protein
MQPNRMTVAAALSFIFMAAPSAGAEGSELQSTPGQVQAPRPERQEREVISRLPAIGTQARQLPVFLPGHWVLKKGLDMAATLRTSIKLRHIQRQIDAELAAIKK